MYYHPEARLVYLAHPRTASNATAHVLEGIGFRRRLPANHHARLSSPSAQKVVTDRLEWCVFTTVRNHWDATASWMFVKPYPAKPPWSLDDVQTFCSKSKWIRDGNRFWFHAPDADVILRYETLQEDFDALLSAHGLEPQVLELVNVGKDRSGRDYRELFLDEAAAYIGEYFAEEITEYGYAY